ncbi:MAG: dihydroorotate dehydrogenase electron transfer subunit [Paludibacteraceae bacterium]
MIFTIQSNELLARQVWRMRLAGAKGLPVRPGQFVEMAVPGQYLRRPISVCDYADGVLTIIYKVVGVGTDAMSRWQAGQEVDILVGLGNGYDLACAGEQPLLIGGGVGVPPLYMLARVLREQGKQVRVVLGFNTKDEVFYEEEFRALGCEVEVTTVDGLHGTKGFVTNAWMEQGAKNQKPRLSSLVDEELRIKDERLNSSDCESVDKKVINPSSAYYYACGPLAMLKAVVKHWGTVGEVSMEERMGCGFGACMGCSIQTKEGTKRVCKDGPVFRAAALEF